MLTIRPVLSLILAVWFLQLSGGMLSVVTPVGLSTLGSTPIGIGTVASLHALGFMGGAYLAPRLIGELGNIRVFAAAAALTAIGAIAQGLWLSELGWALIRFIQGTSFAAMFAAAEAWLGRVTKPVDRGSVLGTYNVAAKAALLVGPLIIIGMSPLDPRNFLWCGLFLAAALVPVCITRRQEPSRIPTGRLELRRLIKISPAATSGVFLAGFVNSGTLALLPIYAASLPGELNALAIAAYAYSIANVGGLLSQWPAGRLSDRVDRRNVIAGLGLIAACAAIPLCFMANTLPLLLIYGLLFLWGAGSLSFYGVCIAHGVDRVEDEDVTPMMSMMLLVWAVGSVIGPVVAGLVMRSTLGAYGLFAFSASGLFLLVLIMLIRRADRAGVPDEEQVDWQPALPAGLPGGDLDPRT